MTSVSNDQSNIMLPGKQDPFRNIFIFSRIHCVPRLISNSANAGQVCACSKRDNWTRTSWVSETNRALSLKLLTSPLSIRVSAGCRIL